MLQSISVSLLQCIEYLFASLNEKINANFLPNIWAIMSYNAILLKKTWWYISQLKVENLHSSILQFSRFRIGREFSRGNIHMHVFIIRIYKLIQLIDCLQVRMSLLQKYKIFRFNCNKINILINNISENDIYLNSNALIN